MIPKTRPFPNRITLELTNRCNLYCVMCPRRHIRMKKGFMDWRLFKKIIDEAARHLPVAMVPFFRGESLLHPDFIKMINYAKSKGVEPIQLATNAMLLDDQMAGKIIDSRIDFVSFSLDSVGKKHYESIRIKSDYDTVTKNVQRFLELKKERKSALPEVQVSVVKTDKTKKTIKDFVKNWSPLVDRVRIYEEHSYSGSFGALSKTRKNNGTRRACHKVFTDIVIYWNGDAALCNHDWKRRDFIGRVGQKSIEDIWTGPRYEEIRQWHANGPAVERDSTCKGCDHWKIYYKKNKMIGDLYER